MVVLPVSGNQLGLTKETKENGNFADLGLAFAISELYSTPWLVRKFSNAKSESLPKNWV